MTSKPFVLIAEDWLNVQGVAHSAVVGEADKIEEATITAQAWVRKNGGTVTVISAERLRIVHTPDPTVEYVN